MIFFLHRTVFLIVINSIDKEAPTAQHCVMVQMQNVHSNHYTNCMINMSGQ